MKGLSKLLVAFALLLSVSANLDKARAQEDESFDLLIPHHEFVDLTPAKQRYYVGYMQRLAHNLAKDKIIYERVRTSAKSTFAWFLEEMIAPVHAQGKKAGTKCPANVNKDYAGVVTGCEDSKSKINAPDGITTSCETKGHTPCGVGIYGYAPAAKGKGGRVLCVDKSTDDMGAYTTACQERSDKTPGAKDAAARVIKEHEEEYKVFNALMPDKLTKEGYVSQKYYSNSEEARSYVGTGGGQEGGSRKPASTAR
jgi:hypothetical protein